VVTTILDASIGGGQIGGLYITPACKLPTNSLV
jgi:hypothetical protein